MLIDDEPFALKLLTRQLQQLGFSEVICHLDARDALLLLQTDPEVVDVIFCDLQMPQMDGVEFIRDLVSTGFAGGLVLVSGEHTRILQTAEKLAKAYQLPVLGALHKPVQPAQLRQVLQRDPVRKAKTPAAMTYGPERLSRAISHGELENYYQPKVALATGNVVGVEALVRWHHPQDGLVFPDQFIATAEEHDLIDDLTQSVLAEALRQSRRWQEAGLNLRTAVNISMDNLAALDFPDRVVQTAAAIGVPLSSLMLEITESRLMTNRLAQLDILTRLSLKHIGLSIDDFGTGHSTLSQLRDIPFDELKVDQSFVHGACRDKSLRAIFEASVSMARDLGMTTVAEGVEDRNDWDFLRATSCDTAQGYFIARPMPAADMQGWLAGWEARRRDLMGNTA